MAWPQLSWEWVTRSRVVYEGLNEFYGAFLTASSVGVADATIYDGLTTRGREGPTIRAAASSSQPLFPFCPLLFSTGIYVNIGSNVTGVLILYKPVRIKEG